VTFTMRHRSLKPLRGSKQPLQTAFAELVALNELTYRGTSLPRLHQLAHGVFPQAINDPPWLDRPRLGPRADFSIFD
jgi:hypothetical protein